MSCFHVHLSGSVAPLRNASVARSWEMVDPRPTSSHPWVYDLEKEN